MIAASDLIAKFQQSLSEGWGYIWGKSGQIWTQAAQNKATNAMAIKYGSKWIGRRVADCSGLFVWAFKQFGESIYHGSNTIWRQYCSAQGKLTNGHRSDGYQLRPGSAVFLLDNGSRHHIGLYIGDGQVIEARGTRYGVVQTSITRWDEWGELKGVDYSAYDLELERDEYVMYPTLKKGDMGEDVMRLQTILRTLGYDLDADGIYGTKTKGLIEFFQRCNQLTEDGVCGPKTWARLMEVYNVYIEPAASHPDEAAQDDQTVPDEDDPDETVGLEPVVETAAYLAPSREDLIAWRDAILDIAARINQLLGEA